MDNLRPRMDLDQTMDISGIVSLGCFYVLFGCTTAYFTLQDLPSCIHRISHNRNHRYRYWGIAFLAVHAVFSFIFWPIIGLYNSLWFTLYYLWAFVLARKSAPGRLSPTVKTILWHAAFAPRYCRMKISAAENSHHSCGRGPSVLPTWVSDQDTGLRTPPRQPTGREQREPRKARTWHARETSPYDASNSMAQTQVREAQGAEGEMLAGTTRFTNPWEAQHAEATRPGSARDSMDLGPTDFWAPASPRSSGWQPAPEPMRSLHDDEELFVVGLDDDENETDVEDSLGRQNGRPSES